MNSTSDISIGKTRIGNATRLKQIFTFFTGYDIMFEASRKDLLPELQGKLENIAVRKNT